MQNTLYSILHEATSKLCVPPGCPLRYSLDAWHGNIKGYDVFVSIQNDDRLEYTITNSELSGTYYYCPHSTILTEIKDGIEYVISA